MNKNTATIVISGLIGLIVGIALTWGFMQEDRPADKKVTKDNASTTLTDVTSNGTTSNANTTEDTNNTGNNNSNVTVNTDLDVSDQAAGMTVVARATVTAPTWVVITEDAAGGLGRILGARLYFPGSPDGTVELLKGTVKDGTYHAVIYTDNGDKKFDYKVDAPARTSSGSVLEATFKAE